ncbi:hypothetical protein [Pedobacter insulae]|nr:hypothetical protein [Pedobacter insulae]
MKTIIKLLFFLSVITLNSFAQDADKVLARVRYTYSNNSDTLK